MRARTMKRYAQRTLAVLMAAIGLSSCSPPSIEYPNSQLVTERRNKLCENLLKLLPPEQQKLSAAQEEARWLADTSYKAAAGIARVNDSNFPGWAGNYLVNSRLQDRGLCWHYQHDMYRELRRRPLKYFKLGCCVRDQGKGSEHNCLYITGQNTGWPAAWVLDAWIWNGRLQVHDARELDLDDWEDTPAYATMLNDFYTEGHTYPVEHWLKIRDKRKWYELSIFGMPAKYIESWTPEAQDAPQLESMMKNVKKGKKTHPGSLINY